MLGAIDPRVVVLRQPRNIGAEANFRAVLAFATGEYFLWLADDDWLEPNYVSACVAFLEAHPDHSLVAGQTTFYGSPGTEPFAGSVTTLEQERPDDRVFAFYDTVHEAAVFYGVARRALVQQLRFKRQIGADWHMVAGYAAAGKVATLPTTCNHRSAEGISKDDASLVASYGLTGKAATNLHAQIARDAVGEILWRMPPHRLIPLWRRIKLAIRVYLAMYDRWGLVQWTQPSLPRRVELKLHRWAIRAFGRK